MKQSAVNKIGHKKLEDRKLLWKELCAGLLCAAICMSLAVGCAYNDPAQTTGPAPQTAEAPPVTTEAAPQTTEPAPADITEPYAECDALFYGDSITKGNNFDELFPQLRIVDYGINGAAIQDLTERVSEVDACHPAKIFVMAGCNNLNSHNEEECVELFRGLLEALQEACPYAEIYIESMLPLDARLAMKWDCPNRAIRSFNSRLEELAGEYGMTYLDIYPLYEDHGGLNKEMTKDGVHLEYGSFGPWAEVLRPCLEP